MADGEDIREDAALNITDDALTSERLCRRLQPTTLPYVGPLQEDDVLAKGKGAQGLPLEECIRRVAKFNRVFDLIWLRAVHLAAQVGCYRELRHQPKGIEYADKVEKLITEKEDSSLDEILSEEMDLVFLWQLLEDILDSQKPSLDTEKGGISPDPALAALAAAPSCHRRGNADDLFAPISDRKKRKYRQ